MIDVKIQKEMINISNVDIYCEHIFNEKPAIILIHGFLSSTYTFNKLIPLLAEHFSVLAIDLPGFGRSEKSATFRYSYSNYAHLVVKCMEHFSIQKAVLAGHSMGGQISLNIARLYPEKVKKLILLCSSGYLKKSKRFLVYCSYLPFFRYFAKRHVRKYDVKKELQNVLYDHKLITDEMIQEFARPLSENDFYKSLIRLLRHREGDLSSEQLKQIDVETLLIWGEEDRVVPFEIGKRLAKELPNAKIISYRETGHLITEERPKEIVNDILSFVSFRR